MGHLGYGWLINGFYEDIPTIKMQIALRIDSKWAGEIPSIKTALSKQKISIVDSLAEAQVIVTIGADYQAFTDVLALPDSEHRWVHYPEPSNLSCNGLYNCWFTYVQNSELVSVFTYWTEGDLAASASSLLAQKYTNWEWVVVTPTAPTLPSDPRIKIHVQKGSKKTAAELTRGGILVYLEPGDVLTDICLEAIKEGFDRYDSGFVYGGVAGCSDPMFGYGMGWKEWRDGRIIDVHAVPNLNPTVLSNRARFLSRPWSWTRDEYFRIGGHHPELDDYDLLLRTFIQSNFLYIGECLATTSKVTLRGQIQARRHYLYNYYRVPLLEKFKEIGGADFGPIEEGFIWSVGADDKRRFTGASTYRYPEDVIVLKCKGLDVPTISKYLQSRISTTPLVYLDCGVETATELMEMFPDGYLRYVTVDEEYKNSYLRLLHPSGLSYVEGVTGK